MSAARFLQFTAHFEGNVVLLSEKDKTVNLYEQNFNRQRGSGKSYRRRV